MSARPLTLDDGSLQAIMDAAKPLAVEQRTAFLTAVASELAKLPADERGAGSVARLCRELQGEFLTAPNTLSEARHGRLWQP